MSLQIKEIHNPKIKPQQIIKEKMDMYVEGIPDYLPRKNGGISIFCGAGGSGKTQLLMSLFRSKELYKQKFTNVWYICPMSSFLSLENHPMKNHKRVHFDLTSGLLEEIFSELVAIKEANEDETEQEYSCVILDDQADCLKQKDIQRVLNKMLIKARHLCCSFIFTLQSYLYYPRMLRKQLTNAVLFKTRNKAEFEIISGELLNMKKENALTLFNYCFDKPYNHLDIDITDGKLYKNWHELILNEDTN